MSQRERPIGRDGLQIMPICVVCGKVKSPRGRDVAAAAAGGYCDSFDCDGYDQAPRPSSYWSVDEPSLTPDMENDDDPGLFEKGYEYVLDTAMPAADGHHGGAPWFYGWAVRAAFWAGANWQKSRTVAPDERQLPID